jgi:hypothetical protein
MSDSEQQVPIEQHEVSADRHRHRRHRLPGAPPPGHLPAMNHHRCPDCGSTQKKHSPEDCAANADWADLQEALDVGER